MVHGMSSKRHDEIVTLSTLAAEWGISRQAVHKLAKKPGFPEPTMAGLARAWLRSDIDAWLRKTGRVDRLSTAV
jgi:predicted DNA-binding transcriptional regulator AlpA